MTTAYSLRRHPEAGHDVLEPAARLGLSARAFIYLLIGVLALMVAVGHSTAETDQWGALQQINHRSLGHILVWVVAVGLAAYSLWRLSEAVFGVAGDGHKTGARLKSFARACIYAFFAVNALQVAMGKVTKSQAGRQETITAKAMQHSGGRLAVGLAGAVIVIVGLVLIYEGFSRKFEKYLAMSAMSPRTRRVVEMLGVVGTAARRRRVRTGWRLGHPSGRGLPAPEGCWPGRGAAVPPRHDHGALAAGRGGSRADRLRAVRIRRGALASDLSRPLLRDTRCGPA